RPMPLAKQTASLLDSARDIVRQLPADAVLVLTETDLDWDDVYTHLKGCRVLIAAESRELTDKLRKNQDLDVIDLDPEPVPTRERMSLALLKAVNTGHLKPGAHVVVLYNGIANPEDLPEPIDSISLIHLSEHLEQLTLQDLRKLDTNIPLDTLRLVINIATEIGREGREGKPVGTILVVGDTRKVQSMSSPLNFNPFKGYSKEERDLNDRKVREAVKEFAQLDGAILIDADGIAHAACLSLNAEKKGTAVSKGFGTRHLAAAAISRKTSAVAVCVSQTSGTVRVYHQGDEVMHIEPLNRPHVWQPLRLEALEEDENGDRDEE
ncbi:MAG TPA: diadenylate cyclase, partial [Gemmataceae bacterium]|nr:diadenylate cyclase [Gemmataceae bacterium]